MSKWQCRYIERVEMTDYVGHAKRARENGPPEVQDSSEEASGWTRRCLLWIKIGEHEQNS
jgi:hypothetical protein